MKILMTGASGVLGQNLIRALLERKQFTIRALVHDRQLAIENCEMVRGDLNNPKSLEEAATGVHTILHLAALTHTRRREDYFKINVEGTKNLLEACRQTGVKRIIYMSSRAAHAKGGGYSESKLRAEECVKNSSLAWVIFRPAEVYGPGSPDAINKLIQWIRKLGIVPVIHDGNYMLSPVYISDVIPPIMKAIENSELNGYTFILGGPENITFNTLIDRLALYLGVRRIKIFLPVFLSRLLFAVAALFKKDSFYPDQIPRLLCDKPWEMDLPAKQLGYQPRKLEDGLDQFL